MFISKKRDYDPKDFNVNSVQSGAPTLTPSISTIINYKLIALPSSTFCKSLLQEWIAPSVIKKINVQFAFRIRRYNWPTSRWIQIRTSYSIRQSHATHYFLKSCGRSRKISIHNSTTRRKSTARWRIWRIRHRIRSITVIIIKTTFKNEYIYQIIWGYYKPQGYYKLNQYL